MTHDQMFVDLSGRVSRWARANFGTNISKITGQELDEIAPLLGIVEEYAEYKTCIQSGLDEEFVQDAIADMTIYLLDFIGRCNLTMGYPWDKGLGPIDTSTAIGNLCRVVLKGHQGIRGMDNTVKRNVALQNGIKDLWNAIQQLSAIPIIVLANTVFNDIVAKRNWVDNPTQGGF